MNIQQLSLLILLVISPGFMNCDRTPVVNEPLQIAARMADSQIKRYPQPWKAENRKQPLWGYTEGLLSLALERLWKETGDKKYYQFSKDYADSLIMNDGSIKSYKVEDYNIDNVNSGRILFTLYNETNDQRYLTAINTLRGQLKTHPRTSEGGFWHKLRYPSQMWLDGIYMGSPFLTQYAVVFNEKEALDDVINQILTIQKHTYDSTTGLNYHGWDESKQQKWANQVTGQSPNFWGRSMGWYLMGIVDVLDFLPKNHPKYNALVEIFRNATNAMLKVQDQATGTWYQVLDQPAKEGNYLESTVTSMMAYSLLKGVRMGYLDKSYLDHGKKTYDGILKNFIQENGDGTISLTKCCSVAGLGGNPYRDGSFEYYISEPVRDNDPKGVGPFIMAAIEMHLADK
jgi:unsaturated rhamnogalacturonyl hydrolase